MKLLNVPDIRSPGKILEGIYTLKKENFGLWSKGHSFSEKIKQKKNAIKAFKYKYNRYEKDISSIVQMS